VALAGHQEGRLRASTPPNVRGALRPRNLGAEDGLELLLDSQCEACHLVGRAGSGKTLLAQLPLSIRLWRRRCFQRALLSRPVQPMGRDIGFPAGTVEEKLAPWMAALTTVWTPVCKDIDMWRHTAPRIIKWSL